MIRKRMIVTLLIVACLMMCACTANISAPQSEEHVENSDGAVGQNDAGSEAVQNVPVTVTLYHANTMLTGFVEEEVTLANLDSDHILAYLAGHNIVSTDTRTAGFDIRVEDGEVTLYLDLNRQFKDYIKLMSEDSEFYVMGALANSYLSAYVADRIVVTVDGKTLETKYNTYSEPLNWIETAKE